MGNEQSNTKRKSRMPHRPKLRRNSTQSVYSHALSVDSLDLIYMDNYFDSKKHLKQVAKERLAEKKKSSTVEPKFKQRAAIYSDTVISSRRKNMESTRRPRTRSRQSKKSVYSFRSSTVPKKTIVASTSTSTKALPPSTLSTNGTRPSSNWSAADKNIQTLSWHGESTSDIHSKSAQTIAHKGGSVSSTRIARQSTLPVTTVEQHKKQRSILTASDPQIKDSVRRQRSYVISTTTTLQTQPLAKESRPMSANRQKPKKKLVVRGLRNFVNTRNKQREIPLASDHRKHFSGGRGEGGVGYPDIWKREFPSKGKFHPDNFIYDWAEGPKAPPRPFSAMAKCKKHGGRCNDCGLFTCDLCQSCRKCETDCSCPARRGTRTSYGGNPYTPKEAYSEIFGGDGWNKACKVLCNLTEQDKTHPVGGNASKRKQNCEENWAKNNFYRSQIDVLNPYNVPLTEAPMPEMIPQPMLPHPMCVPPMFPMSFMPIMAMPPPMMHYYPPQLPCTSYDPCSVPPPYPYPPSDSFMPVQNYQ